MIIDNNILTLIQTIAIVLGLVYVGVQTIATRRTYHQTLLASINQSLCELYTSLLEQDDATLKLFGRRREYLLADLHLILLENRFYLQKKKILDPTIWEADRALLQKIMKHQIMQEAWKIEKDEYPSPFRAFVEREMVSRSTNDK